MWSTVLSNFLSLESLIAVVVGVVGGMVIGALPGLSAEAMMCDGRLRLRRCVRYLQDTADRFEKAERLIRFDDQMYRIRKQQKIAQEG